MNVNHWVRYMKKEILTGGIRIEVCSLKVPGPLCLKAVLALAYGLPAGVFIFMEGSFSFMYFKKCTNFIFPQLNQIERILFITATLQILFSLDLDIIWTLNHLLPVLSS